MKTIEFIAPNQQVLELTPVKPMKYFLPNWYKEMNHITKEAKDCPFFKKYGISFDQKITKTIKACQPVKDYLNSGYIIPWAFEVVFGSEIIEKNNEKIRIHKTFCNKRNYISTHVSEEFPIKFPLNFNSILKNDLIKSQIKMKTSFFKVNSPWIIKTPPGYSCLFFQPFFYLEERYALLPSIVDTDKYPEPINFPGYMIQNDFKVDPNEPLIAVMPFKRDNFKMQMRLEEKRDFSFINLKLHKFYKKLFHNKKIFE